MAINIKDPDTERAIRRLAAAKGASITDSLRALAEAELERLEAVRQADIEVRRRAIHKLVGDIAKTPIVDDRPLEVIRRELSGGL